MRVFASAFGHETNSFSPIPTNRASFAAAVLLRPGDERMRRAMHLMGIDTIIGSAKTRGDEIVLSTVAFAQPGAPTIRKDYEEMRDEILKDLRATLPVDMVFLILHGAMMAEGYDDCEGDIISAVRQSVGSNVPIGVLLDLHCNVTDAMLDNATIIMACREYPHTDFDERAGELFEQILAVAEGKTNPVTVQVRIPMLAMFHTPREPMRSFVDRARDCERHNTVLQVTLAHGFPWSDFEGAGASVLVTTDGDKEKAASLARDLADEFFTLRDKGTEPYLSIEAALDAVADSEEGTIVLSDGSDNPGGGAAGDSTWIIEECLKREMREVAVALLWDPVAVDMAFAAGEGAILDLRIGGKAGPYSGAPLDLNVRILKLTEDKRHQLFTPEQRTSLGRTALIEAAPFGKGGLQIVLNDLRQQPMHPTAFTEAGCDPWTKRLVVVKSSQHFYAGFAPKAAKVLYCDAPGSINSNAQERPYKKITRPIWPLDDVNL
jgi:microcystin degradation protein MlrC